MDQTDFTKEFTRLKALGPETFVLRGSTIIVELVPDEELKTKGGIIIATPSDHVRKSVTEHKLQVGRVLMTGQGYWDEEKEAYVPLDVEPGAIVILPQYSTQLISTFPGIARPTGNKLALVKESELLAYYPNETAYNTAKAELNA
jgi:co-chaperonin GroES (HSP10)